MEQKATNVVWHARHINKAMREIRNKHKAAVLWFTGLSASGKSTIAVEVDKLLFTMGAATYILDGDNVRHRLCRDLGFSPEDREENIRRIGEMAWLFADSGAIVLTAFISPYRRDRDLARSLMKPGEFFEIFIKADIETCKQRDPKGLYKKALAGEIKDFTGISAPYEEPENPELVIDTMQHDIDECAKQIVDFLIENEVISKP
jgi:adenylylsulfate kinase